jgi:hypothetical protein
MLAASSLVNLVVVFAAVFAITMAFWAWRQKRRRFRSPDGCSAGIPVCRTGGAPFGTYGRVDNGISMGPASFLGARTERDLLARKLIQSNVRARKRRAKGKLWCQAMTFSRPFRQRLSRVAS